MPRPKPFGKVVRRRRRLPWRARLGLALAGAALPSALLFLLPARGFPTLAPSPFFLPLAALLFFVFAKAASAWLRTRVRPRGPWESSGFLHRLFRRFKAALVAAPLALAAAFLYAPALVVLNGLLSGPAAAEHALVARKDGRVVLSSPHWKGDAAWPLPSRFARPANLPPGSLARLQVARGLLGAAWVRSVDFTVLK